MHRIPLSKRIIHITKLESARHLILWIKRVRLSVSHGALLETIGLTANDIRRHISLLILSSLPGVEATIALGSRSTAQNIFGLERFGLEIGVLPWWWQHVGLRALHEADLFDFTILVSVDVVWHERVDGPLGFKIAICHISVIDRIILIVSMRPAWVSHTSFGSLDVRNFHDVSRREVELFLLYCPSTWDVIDILLVSDELGCIWL